MALRDLLGLRSNRGTLRRISTVAVLCASSAAVLVDAAPAQAPTPPINDAYLSSLELNKPNTVLDSVHTLQDIRDTTLATTQSNIFNPCGMATCPGGPAEPTTYKGVSYGKTVWYDYYPNKNGLMQIEASGFDNVICIYQFSRKTFLPKFSTRGCTHDPTGPLAETLVAVGKAHAAYTVQIGGVVTNGVAAGGTLNVKFDYVVSATPRLNANSVLRATPTSSGIQIVTLKVSSPHAKRIIVRCSSGCRSETKRGGGNVFFAGLQGVSLTAGSKLEIFATKPSTIGVYIEYDITAGNFSIVNRCLEPGSMIPRRVCR